MTSRASGTFGLALFVCVVATGDVARAEDPPPIDVDVYGFVLLNAQYATATTSANDLALFVVGQDDPGFFTSARQSRLGVTATRPLGSIKGRAKLEADFYGGFPGAGAAEGFALPRLRVATIGLAGDAWNVTLGQDWVLFAPLLPDTLSHQAVPGWATAGNLWARMWQAQASAHLAVGDGAFDLAGALVAPVDNDVPDPNGYTFAPTAGPGERSGHPQGHVRIAFGHKLATDKPSVLGVSGFVGRERYTLEDGSDEDLTGWGAAVDLTLALPGVTLLAEAFIGQDLAAFMGGVFQGVRKTPGATPEAKPSAVAPIASRGFWSQAIVALGGGIRVALGYGMDDPDDADLGDQRRSRNQALYGTLFWRHAELELSGEVEWLKTELKNAGERSSTVFNLSAIYRF